MIWYITNEVGLSSMRKLPGLGEYWATTGPEQEENRGGYGIVSAGADPLFPNRHGTCRM